MVEERKERRTVTLTPGEELVVKVAEKPEEPRRRIKRGDSSKAQAALDDLGGLFRRIVDSDIVPLQKWEFEVDAGLTTGYREPLTEVIEGLRRAGVSRKRVREKLKAVIKSGQDWSIPPEKVGSLVSTFSEYLEGFGATIPQTERQ